MPYVMMPVPEEHVEEVMQFILRTVARASVQPWDAESVSRIYEDVDEATRSLLAFVARATAETGEMPAEDAARKIQLNVREMGGIMNELNLVTREENRADLIQTRVVTERLANGRMADRRVLIMSEEVAQLVRAAEQEELRSAANPLGEAE
jgi:hypothetical protein